MSKDTRLSPLFHTASNKKLGGALQGGYCIIISEYKCIQHMILIVDQYV